MGRIEDKQSGRACVRSCMYFYALVERISAPTRSRAVAVNAIDASQCKSKIRSINYSASFSDALLCIVRRAFCPAGFGGEWSGWAEQGYGSVGRKFII